MVNKQLTIVCIIAIIISLVRVPRANAQASCATYDFTLDDYTVFLQGETTVRAAGLGFWDTNNTSPHKIEIAILLDITNVQSVTLTYSQPSTVATATIVLRNDGTVLDSFSETSSSGSLIVSGATVGVNEIYVDLYVNRSSTAYLTSMTVCSDQSPTPTSTPTATPLPPTPTATTIGACAYVPSVSVSSAYSGNPASRLTDGNTSTEWTTQANVSTAYITATIPAGYDTSGVDIWFLNYKNDRVVSIKDENGNVLYGALTAPSSSVTRQVARFATVQTTYIVIQMTIDAGYSVEAYELKLCSVASVPTPTATATSTATPVTTSTATATPTGVVLSGVDHWSISLVISNTFAISMTTVYTNDISHTDGFVQIPSVVQKWGDDRFRQTLGVYVFFGILFGEYMFFFIVYIIALLYSQGDYDTFILFSTLMFMTTLFLYVLTRFVRAR